MGDEEVTPALQVIVLVSFIFHFWLLFVFMLSYSYS